MMKKKIKDTTSLRHQIAINYRYYLLLAPYFIFFTIFVFIPVITAVGLSFTDFDLLSALKFVGIENYIRLFVEDDIFLTVLKNTLVFAFITGPICYVLSFLMAWLINEVNPKLRPFIITIFYAPTISGQIYTIWGYIFSSDRYGLVNSVLNSLGFANETIYWLTNPKTLLSVLIIVQIWMSLGTGFLTFNAGLKGTDRNLYEAGSLDGIKNRVQELWYITLPQMAPQLLFGAVMQIVSSFSVGDICTALCGSPTPEYAGDTIITYMNDFVSVRYELGYASAIAVVLFLLMYYSKKLVGKLLERVGH